MINPTPDTYSVSAVPWFAAHLVQSLAARYPLQVASEPADNSQAMPDWIRPTELQVFVPHIDILDCITWPYFRDYIIQRPEMQHGGLQWLAACSAGVKVTWAGTVEDALCIDEATGKRRLNEEAEVCSPPPMSR